MAEKADNQNPKIQMLDLVQIPHIQVIEDTAVRRNDNILSITFCVKNNNVILYDTNGNTPEGNF